MYAAPAYYTISSSNKIRARRIRYFLFSFSFFIPSRAPLLASISRAFISRGWPGISWLLNSSGCWIRDAGNYHHLLSDNCIGRRGSRYHLRLLLHPLPLRFPIKVPNAVCALVRLFSITYASSLLGNTARRLRFFGKHGNPASPLQRALLEAQRTTIISFLLVQLPSRWTNNSNSLTPKMN